MTVTQLDHRHTISRRFVFDAGHRLVGHEGKCKNFHGHRYVVRVYCEADNLDDLGRVIDFSVIKEAIDPWIQDNLDHGMMLNTTDPCYTWFANQHVKADLEVLEASVVGGISKKSVKSPFYGMKYFGMPFNPTAENIGSYIFVKAKQLLEGTGVAVVRVDCQETENCDATTIEV